MIALQITSGYKHYKKDQNTRSYILPEYDAIEVMEDYMKDCWYDYFKYEYHKRFSDDGDNGTIPKCKRIKDREDKYRAYFDKAVTKVLDNDGVFIGHKLWTRIVMIRIPWKLKKAKDDPEDSTDSEDPQT